ncbi:MAG TPA: aspartyl/asparaginyl beta-hydroxylase domain-containing protein [Sphingomicrobium sp.]
MRFCPGTLAAEVSALPESAWDPHPTGFVGNEAVKLVTPFGQPTDSLEGPMAPTEHLRRCRYISEVMAALGGVWGRSRLMGLAAGSEVPPHVDSNYYWRTHLRIHIPVVTNPDVRFTCGGETVHMAAGECWVFDSFRGHDVQNQGSERRIHLVLDTVGGERIWDLMEAARTGEAEPDLVPPGQVDDAQLLFEQVNRPKVMSPWEVQQHVDFLLRHTPPHPLVESVSRRLEKFVCAWSAAWARFGDSDEGVPLFRDLMLEVRRDLGSIRDGGTILLDNGKPLYLFLEHLVFIYALAPGTKPADKAAPRSAAGAA